MKHLIALTIAAAAIPGSAPAQPFAPAPVVAPGNALLTVSAEGRSTRAPDVAVFNAGVSTTGDTAAAALAANSAAMDRVIAELRRAGVAPRDIQTSNLNVEPVYDDPNREAAMAARYGRPYVPPAAPALPKIVGYRASNSVAIRQRDLRNFGRVIDMLVSAGANQVNGPQFTLDEPEPALDQARIEAMKKARARAELYARAAGLRIVRVLSISESGGYYAPQPIFVTAQSMAPPAAPPPPPTPMQPGELQMNATVTVLYELAPGG